MGLATVDFRGAGGPLVEYEMVHCRHCRAGIPKRLYPDQATAPGQRFRVEKAQGGLCYRCGGPICLRCVHERATTAAPCRPYEQRIRQLHDQIHRALGRQALADALGLQRR
jgi:hypothetical protein